MTSATSLAQQKSIFFTTHTSFHRGHHSAPEMSSLESKKRPLPYDQPMTDRPAKDRRYHEDQKSPRHAAQRLPIENGSRARSEQESFAREQTRINQIQEAEQMREWVSKEDEFVLKQSKKKAHIRVKEGRAKTIDWLAVTLGVIDPTRDLLEEDDMDDTLEVIDPAGVFEGLGLQQLQELGKDIQTYLHLELNNKNRKYWSALSVICKDHQKKLAPAQSHARMSNSVSADVDRLLSPKNLEQLGALEKQISAKLQSNEPIDVEYWEQLLQNVEVYKSRAELNVVYKSIIQNRLTDYRTEQASEAAILSDKLRLVLENAEMSIDDSALSVPYSRQLDPEPKLRLRTEDKTLDMLDEEEFMEKIKSERQRVLKLGYVPLKQQSTKSTSLAIPKAAEASSSDGSRFAPVNSEDFSSATTALYEREVARGVQEDEEIFAGEEEVSAKSKPQWASKYRPRKPRYFNRVQMGYEWNKYNQTHYDHDNPPPKVVQGYKFNIFYPDLIDKTKAPTYRIERENGRKRGETFAPAGEEDTCLIRFISGPPYEDVAFKIIDREWDFSAKRERGFRSSFDKVSL